MAQNLTHPTFGRAHVPARHKQTVAAMHRMHGRSGHELDHCPTCGRKILDFDPNGYEDERGQRGCLTHKGWQS